VQNEENVEPFFFMSVLGYWARWNFVARYRLLALGVSNGIKVYIQESDVVVFVVLQDFWVFLNVKLQVLCLWNPFP